RAGDVASQVWRGSPQCARDLVLCRWWYARRERQSPRRRTSGGRPPCRGWLATHVAEELSHGTLEIAARHNYVHNAVLEEKLGGLESFGQLLPDRLLDHARSGKPDHGPRLRQNCVAEHRETGAHSPGCRIREDRHVRDAA